MATKVKFFKNWSNMYTIYKIPQGIPNFRPFCSISNGFRDRWYRSHDPSGHMAWNVKIMFCSKVISTNHQFNIAASYNYKPYSKIYILLSKSIYHDRGHVTCDPGSHDHEISKSWKKSKFALVPFITLVIPNFRPFRSSIDGFRDSVR